MIAQHRPGVGKQPVRPEYRLRSLQMRVRRHRSSSGTFGFLEDDLDKANQVALQVVDCFAYEQAQIGSDLLVAAASGMQLQSNVTGQFGQPALEKMMDVLRLAVLEEMRIALTRVLHVFHSLKQRVQFCRREHTDARKGTNMRTAGGDFLRQQSLVERKRPLPPLEFGI